MSGKNFKDVLKHKEGKEVEVLLKNGAEFEGKLKKVKSDYIIIKKHHEYTVIKLSEIAAVSWEKHRHHCHC